MLFIFDDVVNDVKNKKYLKNVENYFAFGRKKGLTIFFLTQSYFQTQKFFRDNCNYILLLSIKSNKDLKRIISEFSTKNISAEQIVNMFEYCTQEQLNFMKITPSYDTPDTKKFSKNWLEFLNPKDFDSNLQQIDDDSDESDEEESEDQPITVTRKKKTTKSY